MGNLLPMPRTYWTYYGWSRALLKMYPPATFEGGKDICQAFSGDQGVGEWDGDRGVIY